MTLIIHLPLYAIIIYLIYMCVSEILHLECWNDTVGVLADMGWINVLPDVQNNFSVLYVQVLHWVYPLICFFFSLHIRKGIVPFLTLSHLCCIYLCLHHVLIGYGKQNTSVTIQKVFLCYMLYSIIGKWLQQALDHNWVFCGRDMLG